MRCACAVLYCHLGHARLYNILSHYLINGMIFDGEKAIEHKMCVSIFCTPLFETFLILRRTERDIIKNLQGSSCKVTAILDRF